MGCLNLSSSTSQKEGSASNVDSEKADLAATIFRGVIVPFEVIFPDPDLGWQRIAHNVNVDQFFRPETRRISLELPPSVSIPLAAMPSSWKVIFLNSRTNKVASFCLPIIALAAGIRSARLAEKFGIATQLSVPIPTLEEDDANLPRTSAVNFDAIYKRLHLPDYGWRLLEREWNLADLEKKKSVGARFCAKFSSKTSSADTAPPRLTAADVKSPSAGHLSLQGKECFVPLQKMRSRKGKTVLLDCGSVVVNLIDQLLRLERSQKTPQGTAGETFGWRFLSFERTPPPPSSRHGARQMRKVQDSVVVASPDGEALHFIPEELIMNVGSWVQDTYLTQTAF